MTFLIGTAQPKQNFVLLVLRLTFTPLSSSAIVVRPFTDVLLSLHESTHTMRLKGSFSLWRDRPVDQDKGFKLSKLSLLGVPQKASQLSGRMILNAFAPHVKSKSLIVQNAHQKQRHVCFFFLFLLPGCNFVLAHTLAPYLQECYRNVWSLHERWDCAHKMLIRAGVGIFPPSDLYQVQDHGWVIWLIAAFLLQSPVCGGNDRACFTAFVDWSLPFFSFVYSWFSRNVCSGSSPECQLHLEFVGRWRQAGRYTWREIRDRRRLTIL